MPVTDATLLLPEHCLRWRHVIVPLSTLLYRDKVVLNGYSSTGVSLWDSLMFGRVLEYSGGDPYLQVPFRPDRAYSLWQFAHSAPV